MRIAINPINVETDAGLVLCAEAEVSVAVSNTVAIRIVPVGPDGTEYSNNATGIVGGADQPDIETFLLELAASSLKLMQSRGM